MDTLQELELLEQDILRATNLKSRKNVICENCEKVIEKKYFNCVVHGYCFCVECGFLDTIDSTGKTETKKVIDCHKFMINNRQDCIMERRIKL